MDQDQISMEYDQTQEELLEEFEAEIRVTERMLIALRMAEQGCSAELIRNVTGLRQEIVDRIYQGSTPVRTANHSSS